MRAYETALADSSRSLDEIDSTPSKPGSVVNAVTLYFGSMKFGNLASGTRHKRRLMLEHFREEHGDRILAELKRHHIEAMLAAKKEIGPFAARNFLQALRAMIATAIPAGLCAIDPTTGICNAKPPESDGFRTWTEDQIAQYETRHVIGTPARLAFGLLFYTAQRRSDVIRMGRQHMRNGFISVRQQKTGKAPEIPIAPALQKMIDATPAENLTFLTTAKGQPFTPDGFSKWFRDRCREAGLPPGLTAHGLRKAWCARAAERGCTEKQIAAISGHTSLKEVQRYTKAAEQKRLARAAMAATLELGTEDIPGTKTLENLDPDRDIPGTKHWKTGGAKTGKLLLTPFDSKGKK